jgi:alpha-beta hydrolase superfamily lysophospholipase
MGGLTMEPIDAMDGTPRGTGVLARACGGLLMRTLFRPVFGWRGGDTTGLQPFVHTGADGSWLTGAVCASRVEPAHGVVLLCHPFLKYGMHYFFRNGYHDWLADAGYHVVAFDFKGFGRSTVGGLSFAADVVALGEWTRQRYPGLPVHLLGTSFGAFHAIHAIATGDTAFASVLFDSVPASVARFFGRGATGAVMRWLGTSRWADATGTRPIFRSLPLPEGLPRLFLFGADDPFITAAEVDGLRRACGADSVRVYPGCGHLDVRKAHPGAYRAAILAFFDGASLSSTLNKGHHSWKRTQ